MVTSEGRIKVLDFGLAKLVERSHDDPLAATQTMKAATAEGVILGTVAYMSPEQAEGKKIDARSDIFNFGTVLYEMLTGRKAFEGGSPISTLAAILHKEPELGRLSGNVPRDLEKLIGRCLRKDPSRRFQVMDDVRIGLQELAEAPAEAATPSALSRRWTVTASVAVAALVAGFGLAYGLRPATRGREASSYRMTPLATEMEVETNPAWSPDGKSLAYVRQVDGIPQIFLRSLGSPAPAQITKSAAPCFSPYWSPDGTRLYYHSERHLWSVGAAGGAPNRVLEDAAPSALSPDGKTFVLMRGVVGNFSLWITSGAAAKPEPYRRPPFPEAFGGSASLAFSPDGGKLAVVVARKAGTGANEVWILPHPSGSPRRVLASVPSGAAILRAAWMPDSRNIVFSAEFPGISGVHLYLSDIQADTFRSLTSSTTGEDFPSVSPDGSRIAFASVSTDFDLVEVPLQGGPVRPLLSTARSEQFPAWAPSGTQYVYATDAGGTAELWLRSTQEGWARPLLARGAEGAADWSRLQFPVFSPDGQKIAYDFYGANHSIWISPVAGGRPVRLDSQSDDQHGAAWSPDGNWIAYRRVQADKWQLVKTAFGGGAAVVLVEDVMQAGGDTAWSPAGDSIAFLAKSGQVHLVSPDGKVTRPLTNFRPAAFGFSKDGSVLYAVQRAAGRKWVVVSFDVRSGKELKTVDVPIPPAANVLGFSLHPDGTRFATSIGVPKSDIWLLEGFQKP
jgi:Tol biopolymer transport system component